MSEVPASTPRLTDEQRRAILIKTASVALGAGAGCGKTTVLTERFLDEIEDAEQRGGGRSLRSLIALTFTEKAARELRQRIRGRCREKLKAGAHVGRWAAVLRALEAAPIGTFHEFCGGLLRDNALALGIDPEFAILDQTIAGAIRDQAIRTAIRKLLAERDPALTLLGVDYGLGQIRQALGLILAKRAGGHLGGWAELTADELLARWREVWQREGKAAIVRALAPVARECRILLEQLPAGHARLRERRDALLDRLPALESGDADLDRLGEVRALARIDDLREKGIWPSPFIKDAVKGAFKELREGAKKAAEKMAVSEAASLESAENCLRLARVADLARLEYDAAKASRRGLDFDDLLLRTLELLSREEGSDATIPPLPILETLDFILVDEFQDTDRTQSAILKWLGGDGFSRGRMFVVGDTKQSIYRFRGAEPAIFDRWRTDFPEDGRLLLTENFRSVPGIIHFVNALFAESFREPSGADHSPALDRLTPVRGDGHTDPAVTFLWALPPAEKDEPDEHRGQRRSTSDERRSHEARVLAAWLRERLDGGWQVVDRETRGLRPAHAGDVAFLFRAMTDVWHYETALADAGFDYHTIGGSAFYAQQEVRDLVNVLSAVEDPLDEVALAGALRSPFFSVSDEGLFWLGRKFQGGLTEGIRRTAEIDEFSDRDRAMAVRAAELLSRWRDLKDRVPLAALVVTVLDESGFEPAVACEFLGSRKIANTRKLVRIAREFDRQEGFTLADLVARLRADLDDPPREEQASTTDENSPTIRLLSIHQAKGLEFPIVVVPDLNRRPNPPESLVGIHPELGLLLRPVQAQASQGGPEYQPDVPADEGGSVGWMTFRAIEDEEERRESLRLFYVAVTRARDHLILSAGLEGEPDAAEPTDAPPPATVPCRFLRPKQPRADSTAFQLLLDRFDWRSGTFLAALPEGWPAARVEVELKRPDESVPRHRGHSPRLGLQDIERIITSTPPAPSAEERRPEATPRLVDLASPHAPSASHGDRLDRLVSLAIADPDLLRGEPVAGACGKAGRRLVPTASSRLVAVAQALLESWPLTSLFEELAEARRVRRPIERGVPWTLTWRRDGRPPCVVRGRFDLIYRDRAKRWRPVILGTQPAEESTSLLRLLLSEAAAERLGKPRIGPPWWVRRGADGQLAVEARLPSSGPSIDEALTRWIEERQDRAAGH